MMLKRIYKITSLILVCSILTSCASMFASKNQKVLISKGKGVKLTIDGEKPIRKGEKYLLNKKQVGVQITAKKEGFKDENIVVGTYKNHILKYIALPLYIYMVGIPLLMDRGPKSKKFDKSFTIGKDMVPLPVREEGEKEIRLNNVAVDIESENIKERHFGTFKQYYRKEEKKESKKLGDVESIKVKNSTFKELFNATLKKSGFIDTSKKVLKNSYTNNLLLDASVKEITFHRVQYNRMLYADITIDWEVLDYYKNPIYSTTTKSTSGQYASKHKVYSYSTDAMNEFSNTISLVIEDAMEFGLIDFLSEKKVKELLKDNSAAKSEDSFTTISIPKSSKYVSSVSSAVNAGVTIKNKDGHGSGFIISTDGHIITNYHVIAKREDLKVITNDGKEYDATVIRESKIHDLALIKIEAKELSVCKISTDKEIEIGKTIYAIGTPSSKSLSQTVSKGIISGVRDSDVGSKMIQTDVSINSGNSGGALINKIGEVQGVVSGKLVGIGIEGVAFGIPAYEILDRLKLEVK